MSVNIKKSIVVTILLSTVTTRDRDNTVYLANSSPNNYQNSVKFCSSHECYLLDFA